MKRRAFLKTAALTAVALRAGPIIPRTSVIAAPEFSPIATHLLNQVNFERNERGLSSLKLDALACTVAEKHATEMARHNYMSHWGLDGLKPYHRYSFAGGVDAVQENGGALNSSTPLASDELSIHLMSMHRSMHDEEPPNDGHRQTILNPFHTHVGFGFADVGLRVRLCELYLGRYVSINPYAVTAPVQSKFVFSGRLLNSSHSLETIDLFYEPLPTPPDIAWLRVPRPYSLPDDRQTLLPRLEGTYFYKDGSKGTIELQDGGRFRVPLYLNRKQPGIYTMVVWISRSPSETPFPATEVCVRAE
jgi:uncharacterized protein YkwD